MSIAGETDAASVGRRALMRSTVSMMFAPGWRRTMISTERDAVGPPRDPDVVDAVLDLGHVPQPHHAVGRLGQQEIPVLVGLEELVVGGQGGGLELVAHSAHWPVHRRAGEDAPHVGQGEIHPRRRLGIHLHPDRRLLSTPHEHLPHALDLRDALGEHRVRGIEDLRKRQGLPR